VLLGGCVSEETLLSNETELLAWLLLRASNRTQARGTTIRLVVPRAPEVAHDLDIEIAEERLLDVEEWLVERGYLVPADIGLVWGTYTLTPAGLDWLREGMPQPLEAPQRITEHAAPSQPPTGGTEPSAVSGRLSWWRRMFGG
jgi:hypothetical protein